MKRNSNISVKTVIPFTLFLLVYIYCPACTHTPCVAPPPFTITTCSVDIIEINFSNYSTFGSSTGENCACGFVMPTDITEVLGVEITDESNVPIPGFSFSENSVTADSFNAMSPGNWAGFSATVSENVPAGTNIQIKFTVRVSTCNTTTIISAVQGLSNSIGTAGASATGAPNSHICLSGAGSGTVPIELNYFHGELNGSEIALSWETLSEINNDYFSIERSSDGIEFKELTRLPGHGEVFSAEQYEFIDKDPLPGMNYFRLNQVDFDGSSNYSNLVSVEYPIEKPEINIFPNPVQSGVLNLGLRDIDLNNTNIDIYNATGKLMLTPPVQGENTLLEIEHFPKGIYFLAVINDKHSLLEKIIVN